MPERAKSLASAFIAGALALAAMLGVNTTAFAAAECLESPDLHVAQPGHWSYYTDRSLNRRCWQFDPAEPTAAPATTQAAAPATAVNEDSRQSFFSRLFSPSPQQQSLFPAPWQQPSPPPQPQESSNANNAAESAQTISPKPTRAVRREHPKTAPPLTTNGAATAERRDQSRQPTAEKNEMRDPPRDVAEREALFQDFVKWQMERNLFGRP